MQTLKTVNIHYIFYNVELNSIFNHRIHDPSKHYIVSAEFKCEHSLNHTTGSFSLDRYKTAYEPSFIVTTVSHMSFFRFCCLIVVSVKIYYAN